MVIRNEAYMYQSPQVEIDATTCGPPSKASRDASCFTIMHPFTVPSRTLAKRQNSSGDLSTEMHFDSKRTYF